MVRARRSVNRVLYHYIDADAARTRTVLPADT